MYCKNCGKEIDERAIACTNCGIATENRFERSEETNTLAIVGFVLSFFIPIAGLICSIIGYKNAPQFGGKGKGMALAGIILSAVYLAIIFLVVMFYFVIFMSLWSAFWRALLH